MAKTFRTQKDIDALQAPPRDSAPLVVMHERVPGFGIRIMPPKENGRTLRTWIVRLGEKREVLGEVGLMKMNDAEMLAAEKLLDYRRNRQAGVDTEATFGKAWREYVKIRGKKWSPSTRGNYDRRIRDLEPLFHKKLRNLTSKDLQPIFEKVAKRARARNVERGLPGEGENAASSLGALAVAIFNFAIRHKLLAGSNPMSPLVEEGLIKPWEPRSLIVKKSELPKLWHWMHHVAPPHARDWMLICMFMGLRVATMGELRWSWVDTDEGAFNLTIPVQAPGNKRKQAFTLPIPPYLIEHLFKPRLAALTKHERWIIESPKHPGEPYRSLRSLWAHSLKKHTEISLNNHALRRTASTLMYLAVGDKLLVKRLLSHSLQADTEFGAVTGGYIVSSTEELRRAMQLTIDFVLRIVQAPGMLTDNSYDLAAQSAGEILDDIGDVDE